MGKKFYIADLHYGHENVLKFDQRPFESVDAMDQALVENWNRVVTPGDTVYVLGDMFLSGPQISIPVLQSLHGQKFLIKGNHDRCNDGKFLKEFVKVAEYLEIDDEDRKVILCHYPIPCYKNHLHGAIHLYGHVHNSREYDLMEDVRRKMVSLWEQPCPMYNVGVMMPYMNYTPRTLDEIIVGEIWNKK